MWLNFYRIASCVMIHCERFVFLFAAAASAAAAATSWPPFSFLWDQLPDRFGAEPWVTAAGGLKFGQASRGRKKREIKIWPNVTAAWGWFWARNVSKILIRWPSTAWHGSEEDVSVVSIYQRGHRAKYINILAHCVSAALTSQLNSLPGKCQDGQQFLVKKSFFMSFNQNL